MLPNKASSSESVKSLIADKQPCEAVTDTYLRRVATVIQWLKKLDHACTLRCLQSKETVQSIEACT
jgi:hypothetical protein